MLDPRRAPARVDLPAQRPQLGQLGGHEPRAWTTSGSTSSPTLTGEPARLHGLWLGGAPESADTPVLLYLHGARYNVAGSAPRMRRMHELGFSVLAIDYRGFGKSSAGLPSEDTRPARTPAPPGPGWPPATRKQHRYIFGHSLGGAIGIDLASQRERRERHHRREHLHLDRRRGEQLQVGLAALRPAHHPALRGHQQGQGHRRPAAGGARQRPTA